MATVGARILAELRGDRVVWAIVLLLAVLSLLTVYSSTGTLAYRNNMSPEGYLIQHFVFIAGGLFITYICYLLHYQRYSRFAPYLLLLCVPLLLYTLALGPEINNARRWIMIPVINKTFQTSDFAKLALIVYVARVISAKQEYIKEFKEAFLPIIVPVLIVCGLIAPADLSTASLLFFTCVLMMFIGRVALKYIGLLLLLGVVLFAFLIVAAEFAPDIIRLDTWTSRVNEFANNPLGGDQVQQSKIAIARGGIFGEGPGDSIQRNSLPAAYSDFIYAIIVEEYGLLGGIAVIGLYLLLFMRCVKLITKSDKAFGAIVVFGLGLILTVQAFANIAVAVHLVPVTGLTLPLISMGGTSVLFTSIMVGIILSVSKYIEQSNLNNLMDETPVQGN